MKNLFKIFNKQKPKLYLIDEEHLWITNNSETSLSSCEMSKKLSSEQGTNRTSIMQRNSKRKSIKNYSKNFRIITGSKVFFNHQIMNRIEIRKYAMQVAELESVPNIKPLNYKFNIDNCNCNKGLLPAVFYSHSILVKSIVNGIIYLENLIIINGNESSKINADNHKVTCKICNQYIRF